MINSKNVIKTSLGFDPFSLNKFGWAIGNNNIGYGTSSVSGYYNGADIPIGGYVIYESINYRIVSDKANNDAELISKINNRTNNNFTTVEQVFNLVHNIPDLLIVSSDTPGIITNGLTSYYDFSKTECYPKSGNVIYNLVESNYKRNHGSSKWYAMKTDTVYAIMIYPDTNIIEEDTQGNKSVIISCQSGEEPKRTTFVITQGYTYYGTKPIHMMSLEQDNLVPHSVKGRLFGLSSERYLPSVINIHSVGESGVVKIYENNGIDGEAVEYTIEKNGTLSITGDSLNPYIYIIESSCDVIISHSSSSNKDCYIVYPMSVLSYARGITNGSVFNLYGDSITPLTNIATYNPSNPNNLIFGTFVADGSGSDAHTSIPIEYLSDTYAYGESLSDFSAIIPYSNTTITVSYYTTSWQVGEVINESGTLYDPIVISRDGTNGFGVTGSVLSGLASDLASGNNIWKFESNKPFALIINDPPQAEEPLLGWMTHSDRIDGQLINGASINNDKKSIRLDGTNDYIFLGTSATASNNYLNTDTISAFNWVRTDDTTTDYISLLSKRYSFTNNNNGFNLFINNLVNQGAFTVALSTENSPNANINSATPVTDGQWHYVGFTYDGISVKVFVDGALKGESNVSGRLLNYTENLYLGISTLNSVVSTQYIGEIDFGGVQIYDRTLSEIEVKHNYDIDKDRFGGSYNNGLILHLDMAKGSYLNDGLIYELSNENSSPSSTFNIGFENINGGCATFNGTDGYLTFNNYSQTNVDEHITITGWVYINQYQSESTFVTKISSYYTRINNIGQIKLYTFQNGGDASSYLFSNASVPLKSWTHIAFTEDTSGYRKIYINGILDNEGQYEPTIDISSSGIQIGRQSVGSNLLNGKIASVKIFNNCLTDKQIKDDYNSIKNRFGHTGYSNNIAMKLYTDYDNPTSVYDAQKNIWTDISGNNSYATALNGVSISPSVISEYNFDGTNDYLEINNKSNIDFGTADFSISVWINSDINDSVYQSVIYNHYDPGYVILTNILDGVIRFWLGGRSLNGNISVTDGKWHYIVINRIDDIVTIYIDGELDKSTGGFSGRNASSTSVIIPTIGRYYPNGNYPFTGKISNPTIYRNPLTQDEILTKYNELKWVYTPVPQVIEDGLILNIDAANPKCYTPGEKVCYNLVTGNPITGANGEPGTGIHVADPLNFPTYDATTGTFFNTLTTGLNVDEDLGTHNEATYIFTLYTPSLSLQYIMDARNGGASYDWFIHNYQNYNINFDNRLEYNTDFIYDQNNNEIYNKWSHIVITSNNIESRLYINGVDRTDRSDNNIPLFNNFGVNFRLFTRYTKSNGWVGNIGPIQIYNRVLSLDEIKHNYFAIRGRFDIP